MNTQRRQISRPEERRRARAGGRARIALFLALAASAVTAQTTEVEYRTADGGSVVANLYGDGSHAVLLAHGAIFDKESWHALAEHLSAEGLTVLAIDFRGYGRSRAGSAGRGALHEDVIAGVRFLAERGASEVSVLGASMGGGAVGEAAADLADGEIAHLILLAAVAAPNPERMTGTKLFVVSEGDAFRRSVEDQFRRAVEPKRIEILGGNAHAQHIFRTAAGPALTELIVAELTGTR
jgi:alpha-beta hydrolase superfamily lysophospholipase